MAATAAGGTHPYWNAFFLAGDQVYVQNKDSSHDRPLECLYDWCGFTGFLMKPTDDNM